MVAIEDKLSLVRYRISPEAHIKINKDQCKSCSIRSCLYVCPAACYTVSENGDLQFAYEGCLECGSCGLVCNEKAIDWNYPRGGFGVSYRFV